MSRRASNPDGRTALARLRALAAPKGVKVMVDAEGFPIIPGRYGQVEWYCDGVECWSCPLPSQVALAVHTDRPKLFARILAILGVKRYQKGDSEMRAVFPLEALHQVARTIKVHRKRILSPEAARKLGARTAYRSTSAG